MALQSDRTQPARYRCRSPRVDVNRVLSAGPEANRCGALSSVSQVQKNKNNLDIATVSSSVSAAAAASSAAAAGAAAAAAPSASSAPSQAVPVQQERYLRVPVHVESARASNRREPAAVGTMACGMGGNSRNTAQPDPQDDSPVQSDSDSHSQLHPQQQRRQQPIRSRKEGSTPVYAHWHAASGSVVSGAPTSTLPAADAEASTPADRSSAPNDADPVANSSPPPSPAANPHWVPQPPSQLRRPHSRSFSTGQLLQISSAQRQPVQSSSSGASAGQDYQRPRSLTLAAHAHFGDTDTNSSQPISPAHPEAGKKDKATAVEKEKGMWRITRFFRGPSVTHTPQDKENNKSTTPGKGTKPLQPHQLGHKGMSKSTSHLPLVLSHAHPSKPSPVPLPPSPLRRAAKSDDLGATSSKLPVTNDGISIPPTLEEVDCNDVALDAVEPGGSGASKSVIQLNDPGNSGITTSPTTLAPGASDGQRNMRPKTAGQEQPVLPPPNPPYTSTSRPTPPTTTTSNSNSNSDTRKMPRNRLSMAFGGWSKKPQSGDSDTITKAWRLSLLSEADSEDYDLRSLNNGGEVSDLWDPEGDTLVYLSAPPLPGQSDGEARFRITSSPLMFAVLNGCVVEVTRAGGISSIEEEPIVERLGPDDLFLSIPTSPAEEGGQGFGDWGNLNDMVGGGGRQSEAEVGGSGRKSIIPESFPPTSGGTEGRRFSVPPPLRLSATQANETNAVRYKIYYSRVAQEARSDHGDHKSSNIIRLLDARNLFAFLDKQFLVASLERINAFRILERLYFQLFIEPSISSSRCGKTSPSGNSSPPGSPRLGPGRLGKGTSGGVTPPRTPNSLPGTGMGQGQLIDNLLAKVMLAEPHLEYYINELKLDDVRALSADFVVDPGKPWGGLRDSMEAMYLGEMWRSSRLFLEGYLHTVGRWEEIKQSRHPLVEFLTPMTLSKLDRAALDLENREREVIERFTGMGGAGEFVFPAMFSGVGKYPKYKRWREGFADLRELVVKHLKWVYGSWPPRAGKKGKGGGSGGERGGLNREVLKRVERDVGMLWEVIVDWGRPRYPPGGFGEDDAEEDGLGKGLWKVEGFGREGDVVVGDQEEEGENDLRSLLEEWDRASPPVQPRPMFDMPRLPKLPGQPITPRKSEDKKDKSPKSKKVKGDITKVLGCSWNNLLPTILSASTTDTATELVGKFKEMELEFAQNKVLGSTQGRTIEDLQEYRKGCWVFIYAVLQSLPMLVVDAPIVRWNEGCEYFLAVGWKHPVLPWEDRDGIIPRVKGLRAAQPGNGNKRASVMWASAPGGAAPSPSLLPPGMIGGELNLSELALAAGVLPEAGKEEDQVGAAYHRSYCWVRAAGWCVKWEEGKRRRRGEELRRVLERERGKWGGELREGLAVGSSDYGSGEGSVVMSIVKEEVGEGERRTPTQGTPGRGSPSQALQMPMQQQMFLGYNQGLQYPPQQQQYQSYPGVGTGAPKEEQRTSSLGSRSVGSAGSAGSGSGSSGGGELVRRRTATTLVNVDDIPETLLPSTRDRRKSSYGGGNWGGMGQMGRR